MVVPFKHLRTWLPSDIFVKLVHINKKGDERLLCRFGLNTGMVTYNEESRCYSATLDQS